MRKILANSVMVLMVLLLSAGFGMAGNGQGSGNGNGTGKGNGNGARNGTGPIHDIFEGTPFTYVGDVIGCIQGQGMEIATETDGNVIIYGIGPVRYWDSLENVDRPAEGDTVTVTGYAVDYNGDLRNIAVTIGFGCQTIDEELVCDETVELRDEETGAPLWRSGKGKNK